VKRIIFSIFTALLAVALLIPATAMAETESDPFVADLLAGQDIDVGDVEVWDDGTDLHVKYVIEDLDWIITETHLYVGIGCPLTSAPGQFPYDDADASSVSDTEVEYVIPLASISDYVMETNKKGKPTGNLIPGDNVGVDPGDCVCIAAHAVVVSQVEGCWETVWQIGDVETADPSSGLLYNYADEFNWGPVGATPTASGPTLAVVEPPFTDPFIVGTTPTLEFPYNSNFVRDYATDFDVQWDGGLLFGGNLTISWSPGISASETKIVYDGIDSDSFSAIGALTSGQGWFENKYPLVEDTFAMGPVAYGTHTINFQHTQGDGTFWDWIRLEKPCEQWETAWGEGDPIDVNGNWSMCFCYDIDRLLVDTVQVPPFGTALDTPIPTYSNIDLEAGKDYLLVASGTYRFANWGDYGIADAAWNYRSAAYAPGGIAGWYQQTTNRLQVWIDGTPVTWQPTTFNPEHIYTLEIPGSGTSIMFGIMDNAYGDNSGYITVDIYELP